MNNNIKHGFTLAEVLITLGIIGIVAALTIPGVIAKYQKKEFATRLRKDMTVLTNGYQMIMAKEGVSHFSDLKISSCKGHNPQGEECITKTLKKGFNNAIFKFDIPPHYTKSDIRGLDGKNNYTTFDGYFWLADGALVFPMYTNVDYKRNCPTVDTFCNGYPFSEAIIDVNGIKGPNQIGRDIFYYEVNPLGVHQPMGTSIGENKWNNPGGDYDYGGHSYCGDDKSKYKLGLACGARIVHDGWEMKY